MAKRALVAGINDYTNWNNASPISAPNLSWCIADATSFATMLNDAFGFDEVCVLQDAKATSQAILGGVKSLLSKSQAGDVVCLYFSGHGGRLAQDGDASGRYYETLVPYDCPAMVTSGQIASIAQSLPPSQVNFTIVLDSCHSGGIYLSPEMTGFRGFICGQAFMDAFVAACQTVVPFISLLDPAAIDGNVSQLACSANLASMCVDPSKDNPNDAKATLLSACDYNENAGESGDLGHGFFTSALLDTVNQSGFEMSHPDLLAALRVKVAKLAEGAQTPQLRGRPVRLQENFLGNWIYSV